MADQNKAYEADTGELDIDMGDHEAAEVEVEQSDQEDAGPEPSEQEELASSAQKRINRLTKKMRDAERQREEALRYAQQVHNEAQQLRSRVQSLDTGYLQEYGTRLELETKTAEAEYKRAVEIGDSEKAVESQRRLNELYSAAQRYREVKRNQEMREQQAQQYVPPQQQYAQPQPAAQPQQQELRRPDPKAESWAERNPWFGQDEVMTFAAFGVHKKLIEDEGFDPTSDEYYNELDRRLQARFGNQASAASSDSSGASRRPAQTVAGVSRANGTARSSGRKKVRLTPTQVAIATKLGVPLEEYAKYVKD